MGRIEVYQDKIQNSSLQGVQNLRGPKLKGGKYFHHSHVDDRETIRYSVRRKGY